MPCGEFVVIGGGLVGPLISLILRRKGYQVTLYERYGDMRKIPSGGRSINLVLTSRGLRALKGLGESLMNDMVRMSVPVTGRIIHHADGTQQFSRYGKDDSEFNLSISRYELNIYLVNEAEKAGVSVNFGHHLVGGDFFINGAPSDSMLVFKRPDGTTKRVHVRGTVIGADGGGSAVRNILGQCGCLHFTEDICPQGYKEIFFPKKSSGGSYAMNKNGLHIWPRRTHFLMALANLDGSFTGTIYIDKDAGHSDASFAELSTPQKIMNFFRKHYATAIPLLGGEDAIVDQMLNNSVGLLGTVNTSNYSLGSKCVLIGDSAHAITPFFGQGTNASFEDCLTLSNMLDLHAPDKSEMGLARAFAAYSNERKPNSDAIATMALENFVEMRDLVADKRFLLMKAVENLLENKFESSFRSRYAMVCYGGSGNITYDTALKLGAVQWSIIEEISQGITDPEQVDLVKAHHLITTRLVPFQKELNVDVTKICHGIPDSEPASSKL